MPAIPSAPPPTIAPGRVAAAAPTTAPVVAPAAPRAAPARAALSVVGYLIRFSVESDTWVASCTWLGAAAAAMVTGSASRA
ncbi:hypothetical protein [Nocardia sp. XZ_19_369]|uniref:hypothetical protein n=1 Tax=Nocardia sp. XZ_19_369 TaxID=2769487 RepID=UPI0018903E62|nr:hypothetical protein [Nocardia sp. XZ_19_369]